MKKLFNSMKLKAAMAVAKAKVVLTNKEGQGALDTVVSILISVILGGFLLSGLYLLFGDTVLPQLADKISEMFNYAG